MNLARSSSSIDIRVRRAVSRLLCRFGLVFFLRLVFRIILLLRLWLGRSRLWLLQDVVGHLGDLLVLLLHLCAKQGGPFVFWHRCLFCPHVTEPLLKLSASRGDLSQLLWCNVTILLTGVLCGCAIVLHGPCNCCNPIITHTSLLGAPCNCITNDLQLIKLLYELCLGSFHVVVKPIFCRCQDSVELVTICTTNEAAILATFGYLITHVENVGLEVVPLLICVDDFTHLCLHGNLLIHQFLKVLVVQPRLSRNVDGKIGALCSLFGLLDVYPLVLLFGLLLCFLIGITFCGCFTLTFLFLLRAHPRALAH